MLPLPQTRRLPRIKTYMLCLCINDSDNGMSTGRLRAVDIGADEEIRLEGPLTPADDSRYLPVCRLEPDNMRPRTVKIGSRKFSICGHQSWVGNWCWDAVYVTRPVLQDIVLHLHKLGKFTLDTAPSAFWDAWQGDGSALPAAIAAIFGPLGNIISS